VRETQQSIQNGQQQTNTYTYKESLELIRQDSVLWTKGSIYPKPGSDILTFPFTFALPPSLPPTHSVKIASCGAEISYFIEAVGNRKGTFKRDHRLGQALTVLGPDPFGASLRGSLSTLPWEERTASEDVRLYFWQEYSSIKVNLKAPQLQNTVPLNTAIPFIINISTLSRPLKREKAKPEKQENFPAPPKWSNIKLELHSHHRVRAKGRSRKFSTTINICQSVPREDRDMADLQIVGETKDRVQVVQGVTYTGTFMVTSTPSFEMSNLGLQVSFWICLLLYGAEVAIARNQADCYSARYW